ncbi:MAG: DUF736 family protein [Aestuariivita sp.]|nr:DUF736 family protein [Aestuariivita sp.]MCY4203376.1 DUF736 family protein [Aestuariivita sp.]
MATIGQFRLFRDGYEGTILTKIIAHKVRFFANGEKKHEEPPDFFIKTGQCELGVTSHEESKSGNPKPYIQVLLDDPYFPTPVNTALLELDGLAISSSREFKKDKHELQYSAQDCESSVFQTN